MRKVSKPLTIASFIFILLSIQGCTPKTAGLDSAYLNNNRGAEGAQITKAEARQYKRQQNLTADEIRLENMKRNQNTDAVQESSSALDSATDAVKNAISIFR
jgi:microcystin-dependent protein